MNYSVNNEERDYITLRSGEFPIHDLMFSGEVFPQEPFVIYTSFLVFSTSQLHSYLRRHFEVLRQCEMENLYSPAFARNIPISLFCAVCMTHHVITGEITPQMYAHFSSGRPRTPHWYPMSVLIPTEETVGHQN